MKARGIGSPDRADAILGAMRKPRDYKPRNFMAASDGRDFSLIAQLADEQAREGAQLAGAACE